jgi:hypothetical protein
MSCLHAAAKPWSTTKALRSICFFARSFALKLTPINLSVNIFFVCILTEVSLVVMSTSEKATQQFAAPSGKQQILAGSEQTPELSHHVRQASHEAATIQFDATLGKEDLDREQTEESSCNEQVDEENPPSPTTADIEVATPEAHAVPVDEAREAKMLEIFNAPLIEGKLIETPGYTKWLLRMSMTCAFLSCLAIAGMAIYVFAVDPQNDGIPMEYASIAPSTAPPTTKPERDVWPASPSEPVSESVPVDNAVDFRGDPPSVSSDSSSPVFAVFIAAIVLTAVFALGFFICFCWNRSHHVRKRRS